MNYFLMFLFLTTALCSAGILETILGDKKPRYGREEFFYSAKKLHVIRFYEHGVPVAGVRYGRDGQIIDVWCGKISYLKEDKIPCGFEGIAKVVTPREKGNNKKVTTYLNGKIKEVDYFSPKGFIVQKRVNYDTTSTLRAFYENGTLRSEVELNPSQLGYKKNYYENGYIKNEGPVYINQFDSKKNGLSAGKQKMYDKSGNLISKESPEDH